MSGFIIDDSIAHYEVLGRGKPVVFLHGWIGSWRYWIPAMQTISISYRAYALDLWGFGDSAKNEKLYTLEKQINLLDRFFAETGIGKVVLIGHGLGAVLATLYAVQNAFTVDRFMAVSLPIKKGDLDERFKTDSANNLATLLLSQTAAAEAVSAEVSKIDERAIRASLEEINFLDMYSITRQLNTASLLVHGQSDPAVKVPDMWNNGDLPSMLHHIVFEDSGHFPMLDEPSKFHRLVVDFLELSSGESPQQLQLKDEWKRRVR